ncbi:hypothetical protein HNQ77_003605 [Silvibacterium bohemicum]|uniref:Uncharacterized protein n=1 Tax=Silvibacterium bohemicum TaxID=1577686 RepID=A0A841K5V4_9BACT|nr:hypothetical protein [Silvibacterium bohemicum]MBB6145644.1 hypothetical protein [Silvibacterium bohemicum]
MRRSTIWFLIACLWLIDVLITAARGHAHQAWLPGLITGVFFVIGFAQRAREAKPATFRKLK